MTDPLIDTPAFHEAVKLAQVASRVEDFSLTQPEVEEILTAALPHLRRMMAEELRAEAKRCDPTNAYPRGPGRWLDAADHLEGR